MDWPCTGGNLIFSQQITKYYGNITVPLFIANFASIVGTGDNHLAWYDLTNQIMYAAFAAPNGVGGPDSGFDRQFTSFDLNKLFAVPIPTSSSGSTDGMFKFN